MDIILTGTGSPLPDPKGQGLAQVREIQAEVRRRVKALVDEIAA